MCGCVGRWVGGEWGSPDGKVVGVQGRCVRGVPATAAPRPGSQRPAPGNCLLGLELSRHAGIAPSVCPLKDSTSECKSPSVRGVCAQRLVAAGRVSTLRALGAPAAGSTASAGSITKLAGLTSRWMCPSECTCSSALSMLAATTCAAGRDGRPAGAGRAAVGERCPAAQAWDATSTGPPATGASWRALRGRRASDRCRKLGSPQAVPHSSAARAASPHGSRRPPLQARSAGAVRCLCTAPAPCLQPQHEGRAVPPWLRSAQARHPARRAAP